jgi:hypothetical protein
MMLARDDRALKVRRKQRSAEERCGRVQVQRGVSMLERTASAGVPVALPVRVACRSRCNDDALSLSWAH